jgi:Spy/CpxP family protein refolding chaperone
MKLSWHPTVPVFLLGLALGAAGGSWGQRAAFHHPVQNDLKHRQMMLDRMSRDLGLDDKQKAAVSAVMDSRAADVDMLKTETFAKLESIRKSTDAEMAKILTAEQLGRMRSMHHGRPMRINWDGPPPPPAP